MATRGSTSSTSAALLVLRLAAGSALVAHGLQKLLVVTPAAFVDGLAAQGLPVPALLGWLLIAGEIGLGTLVFVGLLAKPAAGLAALMLALVYLSQHLLPAGFVADGAAGLEGESALLLLAITLALAVTGPGRFAVDGSRVAARATA